MAFVTETKNMRFTPDETGGGWLEWDEVIRRKGFRDVTQHRKIRKEALAAAPEPKEAK